MSEVRKCDNRFYDGEYCPECGGSGELVLSSGKRKKASKFLSGLLRHFPSDFDIEMDDQGWVSTGEVLKACQEQYDWINSDQVLGIVATDKKGRFEVDGYKIRASYGHSVDYVELEENNKTVPNYLYHGTARDNISSILDEGLKSMNRQNVHMTDDKKEAKKVAHRHCDDPVLLRIDAESMINDDLKVIKRGRFVYTSEHVPSEYIKQI